MAKVVFCYPAWTGEGGLFGWFSKRNGRWPPLNIALLGAVAQEAGHEAVILDAEVMGWKKERLAAEIIKLKPDIVGFTGYSPFFHLSRDAAREVKRLNADIPTMVGGPHVTITREKVLRENPEFDYAFVGEAEDSLPEFLNALSAPKNLSKVRGIMYRENGEVESTGERWVQTEAMTKKEIYGKHPLDRFPLPARHLLPMERYRLGTPLGRQHFTSLQTARGCPWR